MVRQRIERTEAETEADAETGCFGRRVGATYLAGVMQSTVYRGFIAVFLLAAASVAVRAQVVVDALVVDVAGAPVASADVSLRSLPDSVVVHAASTDSAGRVS